MKRRGWLLSRGCRAVLAGMLALLAAGCSDKDDSGPGDGPAAMSVVGGVAAVGAPIVGGTITARCGGGQTFSTSSTATGSYSIELPSSALPCALQVTGGQVNGAANALTFHSFASAAGTTNLTPLTDLAVAIASGMTPSAWFAAISANAPPQLRNLANAAASLLERLEDAGYTVPGNLNPFTTPFTATLANAYDQLLESLGAALRAAAMSYDQLLVQVVADGADFDPPEPEDEEEPNPSPGDTTPGTVKNTIMGSYTLVFEKRADGSPFTDGQQVPVIVGSDNSLQIDGKTLRNPFNRTLPGGTSPHLPELIWRDEAKKLEYALSDNQSGNFNEINVADYSQTPRRFLGQLDEPAPANGIPPQLQAIGGSYTQTVVESSGTFGSSNPLASSVTVLINQATGVIDIDGARFTLAPGGEGYFFESAINTIEPSYRVLARHTDGNGLDLQIFIQGTTVAGFKLVRSRDLGNGGSAISNLVLEPRPLPQGLADMFTTLVAKSPITLTAVLDDPGYNSGYTKCQKIELRAILVGQAPAQRLRYELYLLKPPAQPEFFETEVYSASFARYEEHNGNRRLSFTRATLVLRGDEAQNVDIESRLGNVLKDRATTDPAQISSNCAP